MAKRKDGTNKDRMRRATEVVLAGRNPSEQYGFVNTPIYRGSTVLSPTVADYVGKKGRYVYGRRGTPTTEALAQAISKLEGSAGTTLVSSGLSAITTALMSVVRSGDHVLVADTVYGPTRHFCDTLLSGFGADVAYYDPLIGAKIADLFRPNTRAVFLESPGSLSFEVQDVPAIAEVAQARGAAVLMDNTWATPLFFRAHDFGVDLSIQAGTKYLGGHADANLGTISTTAKYWPQVKETVGSLGLNPGPEDAFLMLRGLRTLSVRLDRHMESGLKVAHWLESRPEVLRVLHPALPSHPQHALWKRDFTGACGLFSVVLKPKPQTAVNAFIDALELFGIGASWGGYESLVIPFDCKSVRTATTWNPGGPTVRLHVGLEDPEDLIADLEQGLQRLATA
ncbi:MAG: cystathionine beta-lyase [Bradyrhizobiaceae bacterium]|nr:cystathionine beta-lyase [Bradyrhizobiaceae bacterium]